MNQTRTAASTRSTKSAKISQSPSPSSPSRKRRSPEEQLDAFWSNVDVRGPRECWKWKGGRSGPYGMTWWNGVIRAHRLALLAATNFADPGDLYTDHLCHNTLCVNPRHLRWVTPAENARNRARQNSNSSTGILGVHRAKGGRFVVTIKKNGEKFFCGSYKTKKEARRISELVRTHLFQLHGAKLDLDGEANVARVMAKYGKRGRR